MPFGRNLPDGGVPHLDLVEGYRFPTKKGLGNPCHARLKHTAVRDEVLIARTLDQTHSWGRVDYASSFRSPKDQDIAFSAMQTQLRRDLDGGRLNLHDSKGNILGSAQPSDVIRSEIVLPKGAHTADATFVYKGVLTRATPDIGIVIRNHQGAPITMYCRQKQQMPLRLPLPEGATSNGRDIIPDWHGEAFGRNSTKPDYYDKKFFS
jgi:hypothetical protein